MKVKYYLKNDINFYGYFNVQIIVRIRGLGWTLSRVIGRALCRKVSRDADEGPKRRRPTTSAHRQRKAAPAHVVEDVEHVDHVSKEVMNNLKRHQLMM